MAIFLESKEEYRIQSKKKPGTYYLKKCWIEVEDSSFEAHGRLIEQYGEGRVEKYKLPYE